MNYLQDILAQAQQGQAIDNLARSYGISSEQAQQAVEAVLPAFAVGLQRTTQTPQSFAELLGAMSRNPYGQAFNDPSAGFGEDTRVQGNDALGAMFGSPDVSRAVAVQASAASGLSADLLKQMLPAIASLVLGGLMRGGAGGTANAGAGGGGLGDLLGGILGGGAAGGGAQQRPSGSGNPLQDLLGGLLGGAAGGAAGAGTQQRPSGSGNPLDDLLGGILGGGAAGSGTQPRQPGSGNPLDDILGGMLGGGRQVPQQRGVDPDQDAGLDPYGNDRTPGQARPGAGNDPLSEILGGILGGMFGGGGPGGATQGGGAGQGGAAQDPRMQQFQDIFDQFTDRNQRR